MNIRNYLYTDAGFCGCFDIEEARSELLRLLEWHGADIATRPAFDTLYPSEGQFYLMTAYLDNLGLTEHGVSARHGWLTPKGREVFDALRAVSVDELEADDYGDEVDA